MLLQQNFFIKKFEELLTDRKKIYKNAKAFLCEEKVGKKIIG